MVYYGGNIARDTQLARERLSKSILLHCCHFPTFGDRHPACTGHLHLVVVCIVIVRKIQGKYRLFIYLIYTPKYFNSNIMT